MFSLSKGVLEGEAGRSAEKHTHTHTHTSIHNPTRTHAHVSLSLTDTHLRIATHPPLRLLGGDAGGEREGEEGVMER